MIEDNSPNENTISNIINLPNRDEKFISIPIPEYHPNNISSNRNNSPMNNATNSKGSSKNSISNVKSFIGSNNNDLSQQQCLSPSNMRKRPLRRAGINIKAIPAMAKKKEKKYFC